MIHEWGDGMQTFDCTIKSQYIVHDVRMLFVFPIWDVWCFLLLFESLTPSHCAGVRLEDVFAALFDSSSAFFTNKHLHPGPPGIQCLFLHPQKKGTLYVLFNASLLSAACLFLILTAESLNFLDPPEEHVW